MPISEYFGGHGSEVMKSMQQQYGPEHGKSVFYATANKNPEMKPSEDAVYSGGPVSVLPVVSGAVDAKTCSLDEIVFNPQSVAGGRSSAYRTFPSPNEGKHE